ncbi:protein big brother, partial [Caerostris extrusa]
YTGYRDRPVEERQMRFQTACREGHTEVAFIATGTNLQLMFSPCSNGYSEGCDFNKEQGKVHIKSCFIMNGVCVRWRGWLDIERLDGVGCLEYDEERAQIEDAILREQLERYQQRLRDFDEKQRLYRSQHERHAEVEVRTSRLGKNRALQRSTLEAKYYVRKGSQKTQQQLDIKPPKVQGQGPYYERLTFEVLSKATPSQTIFLKREGWTRN